MLFELREIYKVDKIYVLKSTYTQSNKYHIYLPQIVYNNINEMKFDLQTDKKAFCVKYQIDMSVYSMNRIFRLPF